MSSTLRRSTRTRYSPERLQPVNFKHDKYKKPIAKKKAPSPRPQPLPVLDLTKTCCICMDDIDSNKNCVTTECGHDFCASCLFRHLEENDSCPLCRFKLRNKVKAVPTLTPPVAETLISGLLNSNEQRTDTEHISSQIYGNVIAESLRTSTFNFGNIDNQATWRMASVGIRSRILSMMRQYQVSWGMRVCQEISHWIHYVSNSSEETIPNLEEIISNMIENQPTSQSPPPPPTSPPPLPQPSEPVPNPPPPPPQPLPPAPNPLESIFEPQPVPVAPATAEYNEPSFYRDNIPNFPIHNSDRDVYNYILGIDIPLNINEDIDNQILENSGINAIINDTLNIINRNYNNYQNNYQNNIRRPPQE